MPRIFPQLTESQIGQIKSRAEQRFYRACQEQLDNEWLVLHSISYVIRLSGSQKPRDGEADFVIFSESRGFLVVEIKGGGITCDPATDTWTSINSQGIVNVIKDPFEQAVGEKYAILNLLSDHKDWRSLHSSGVNSGHAVFLPDIDDLRPLVMPQAPRAILGGRTDLQNLEGWINRALDYWCGSQPSTRGLGAGGIKIVEQMFCKARSVRPLLSAQMADEEERRIELTHQQARYLRALGRKRRAVISGGAGTGKTLLAVERARELAERGNKTLLLCYNRPLSDYLKTEIGQNDNLLPMTFHQLCEWRIKQAMQEGRDLKREAEQDYPHEDYYEVQLPHALALSSEVVDERFDAIVVDEGQDFKKSYWQSLEWLMREDGATYLYIFLDPNQALYQQNVYLPIAEDPLPLTLNCRNTRHIHEAAYHFYRGEPVDPPSIEGAPVEVHSYETVEAQLEHLHSLIADLITYERVRPADIVVLVASYAKHIYYEALQFRALPKGIRYSIEAHRVPNTVLVDTVSRFKGLEAAIVVLWGIDEFDPNRDKDALYVAFSRAKSRLHIFGTRVACRRALETKL